MDRWRDDQNNQRLFIRGGQSQCRVKALRAVDVLALIKYSKLAFVLIKRWNGRK